MKKIFFIVVLGAGLQSHCSESQEILFNQNFRCTLVSRDYKKKYEILCSIKSSPRCSKDDALLLLTERIHSKELPFPNPSLCTKYTIDLAREKQKVENKKSLKIASYLVKAFVVIGYGYIVAQQSAIS